MDISTLFPQFTFAEEPFFYEPFGCGHINSTYAVYCKNESRPPKRYILQKINTSVFRHPDELMENILRVTQFLRKKIIESGGDPLRETLTVVPTVDGKAYFRAEDGSCWRAYIFIEDTVSYQTVERPEVFTNAARAFGRFQKQLAEFPAATLHETIPHFHDTGSRFRDFCAAMDRDALGRLAGVRAEADFICARAADCTVITDAMAQGTVPLRVTHNDTKLNNILMDRTTGKAVCIIDLDTIMPGSALYDFGDSIRFGASSAAEDEKNLELVHFVPELFEAYARGFLEETGDRLTETEVQLLPMSARLMTLECGMRFLADYLDGDVYFHTDYPAHNLDRARTQLKLVADMEAHQAQMAQIIACCR